MAKVTLPAIKIRTATMPNAPLTSPGGLTQAGGYMARQIDIKSRPRFTPPARPAGVNQPGAPNDRLPKGMD